MGIYCHNIPTHNPQSGYHGVTEVAKTANIAKMAEKCINCTRPTPPHGVGTRTHCFRLKIKKKTKRFMISDPKKEGVIFFDIFDPPPAPPRCGGGMGVKIQKKSFGDHFWFWK